MGKRGRKGDRDRVLLLLGGAEGGLSNAFVKSELSLTDDRYENIRAELLKEQLVETYRCRSGGVRITLKGEKIAPKPTRDFKSSVSKEVDLYKPLCACLSSRNEGDEFPGMVLNVGADRRKGKWQNPDVMQIAVEQYKYLISAATRRLSVQVEPRQSGWRLRRLSSRWSRPVSRDVPQPLRVTGGST